jgi:aryl-alcohol dehydrogenase-like predicted oxidoreductase
VCREYGLGVVSYFPLASGLLTGKYQQGVPAPEGTRFAAIPFFAGVATDANWEKVKRFESFAADHDRTLTGLALGWVASQPETASVLVGATRPEQVAANAAAIDWKLSSEELVSLDEPAA